MEIIGVSALPAPVRWEFGNLVTRGIRSVAFHTNLPRSDVKGEISGIIGYSVSMVEKIMKGRVPQPHTVMLITRYCVERGHLDYEWAEQTLYYGRVPKRERDRFLAELFPAAPIETESAQETQIGQENDESNEDQHIEEESQVSENTPKRSRRWFLLKTVITLSGILLLSTRSVTEPGLAQNTSKNTPQKPAQIPVTNGAGLATPSLFPTTGSSTETVLQATSEQNCVAATIGQWFAAGNMPIARYDIGIALLHDGSVLITGGRNIWIGGTEPPFSETNIFVPKNGTWMKGGDLKTGRMWFGNLVTLNDGRVLIAGGTDITGYNDFNSSEIYDPQKNTWKNTGNLNHARRGMTLTLLTDGRVLIVGGRHGVPDRTDSYLKSAEIYDPGTGKWSDTGSLDQARNNHTAIRLKDGKVLVFGGEGTGKVLELSAEIYDPIKGAWTSTSIGEMKAPQYEPTAILLSDGRVLVAGGNDDKGPLLTTQIYDPTTRTWSITTPLPEALSGAVAFLLHNGKVLVASGSNSPLSFVFDPVSETWTPDAPLNESRFDAVGVELKDGRFLLAGGYQTRPSADPTALPSFEIYTPPCSSQ